MSPARASLDIAPILTGDRLFLRPLAETDRDGLFDAARDPQIWAQHPARDRYQRPVFNRYFDMLLGAGGTVVARRVDDGSIIGCSRFYPSPEDPGDWCIGFTFLARPYWGGDWNREMKALMVSHVLARHPRVWFHIAPGNKRSQIATTRLGATFVREADLALGGDPTPTRCYVMTAEDWTAATGQQIP